MVAAVIGILGFAILYILVVTTLEALLRRGDVSIGQMIGRNAISGVVVGTLLYLFRSC
jgi:hypothetical protein